MLPPRPRFRLPDAKPPQPGWGLASLVVHVLIAALLVLATMGRTAVTRTTVRFLNIGGAAVDAERQRELPPMSVPSEVEPQPLSAAPTTTAIADSGSGPAVVAVPRMVPIGIPPKTLVKHDPVIGSASRIQSSYGSGRLWVGPLEGRLGIVDPSPNPATHAAKVDSAVRAKILAFIDTMPPDSFAVAPVAPWVKEIDGKKWGVDGSWIYLGGLKLPSALLALLPLPQGNYDRAKEEAQLMRIREDIIRAARQAETNADFRRYVKEIRERKDAERAERLRREKAIADLAKRPPTKDTIP